VVLQTAFLGTLREPKGDGWSPVAMNGGFR
jgi:hypothetical protein